MVDQDLPISEIRVKHFYGAKNYTLFDYGSISNVSKAPKLLSHTLKGEFANFFIGLSDSPKYDIM